MVSLLLVAASALTLAGVPPLPQAAAGTPCAGVSLAGTVRDSTYALIPGATLVLDGTGPIARGGADGHFRFSCLPAGTHRVSVSAAGFAARDVPFTLLRPGLIDVTLQPSTTEQMEVSADDDPAGSPNSSGPTQTISGNRLQALADDPDDLERELQQLAAAAGGSPGNATIAVDGFQGSSALPPKSSIAYIKVNPDQFSAEYREPPFEGGRIEVYTRPGQKAFHGALFLTNGSPFENARDPFSTSRAAIGKQRYGVELSGPVRRAGSDFALTLEHRSIDNFAVVNAFQLDPAGNLFNFSENVPSPQRLWQATARVDWQLGAKNTLIASYSANVNRLENLGVGGTSLAETGYNSDRYEHMLRASVITTASAHLMHEGRLSLRWDGERDTPVSTAPQVSVAGAFTAGGASIGPQQIHELNTEWDDDAILTTKSHTMKFGSQMMIYRERRKLTTNFNGSYIFGSVAQYRLGIATQYSVVTGTPEVDFTQVQEALFAQDDWNLGHGVHLAYGMRYLVATEPTRVDGATPRLGVLWSPTKKGTWTLHAHLGMFTGGMGPRSVAEVRREDGVGRVTSLVYNPQAGNPLLGANTIQSVRQFAPHLSNVLWYAQNYGGTRTLRGGWNLSGDVYLGRLWNDERTVNINSPLNGVANGPRAFAPNLNILQVQNSGQGRINAVFAGVENHSYKRVQFFAGAVRISLIDDTDDSELASPQSAFSDAGEFAPRTGQPVWNYFGNATLTLPRKVQLSLNLNGGAEAHYNLLTGFDNNGDGNFNDRPQYAAAGTPGAVQTPYGLLVASGGTGVLRRNLGVMPMTFYLDTNLQRAIKLTRNSKAEHQQTVTLNLRSSNVLNHLNVTAVGGVLGSPLFGVSYAGDNGRRVEAGARYSF